MRLNARHNADALAFAIQGQRQFERLGREHIMRRKLDVNVKRATVLLLLKQAGKIRRIARGHATDKYQSVPPAAVPQFRAAGPANPIEARLLDRGKLLVQRPFAGLRGMPHEGPEIGDVTEDWFVHKFF